MGITEIAIKIITLQICTTGVILQDEVLFFWYEENDTTPVDVPSSSSRLNQFSLIGHSWNMEILRTSTGTHSTLYY